MADQKTGLGDDQCEKSYSPDLDEEQVDLETTIDRPEAMERLMKKLGVMGRYQLIQITCLCLSNSLFVFVILNFVFIGYKPEHTCQMVNETELLERHNLQNDFTAKVNYGSCEMDVTSNNSGKVQKVATLECYGGYDYVGGKDTSMVTEWDLVCGKSVIGGLVQSMFTLGLGLGALFFPPLADRYGRKYVYMFNIAATICTELGLVFAPDIYTAVTLRFFSGFLVSGVCLLHCIVAAELVVTKYRQSFYVMDCFWWSTNAMFLSGVAFLMRNSSWRYLQSITPMVGVPMLVLSFITNETPIWYFAKGRYDDARKILRKACKMNGKDVDEIMDMFQACIREAKQNSIKTSSEDATIKSNYTLIDILRNRYILMLVIFAGFMWFTNSLAYYGLYLTSSTLAGDRYMNFFLMALLEIPSGCITMVMVSYFGRRIVVFSFLALSGFSLLISTILVSTSSDNIHVANASTAFFLLGKFAIGSSFNVLAAYTPEFMVTTVRSVGTGICTCLCRVGGIIAPFLLPLFDVANWAPGAILSALCFICLFLIPLMPETKGRQLPNTIEEILQWKNSDVNVQKKKKDRSLI